MTQQNRSQTIIGVIPARMGSSRFPGKPLARLHGLPMLEHVFRRAKLCSQLDEVYIATCDEEIRQAAAGFGAGVIMTSAAHERATDRVAEAAEHFAAEIVVMIQGDEPMITPEMIETALGPMQYDPLTTCVNLVHRIETQQEFIDPNTIKVVADLHSHALYFSRSPIPKVHFEQKSRKPTALEDLRDVDVVFGGNSSVLIDAVTAGVPSACVDGLDHGSPDLHGFVAAGLIYRSTVDPDFDELLRFYRRPGWEQALRRFANIADDESTVIANTLKIIADLTVR